MSEVEGAGGAPETTESQASLLDQAISVTKQTEPDRVKELLSTLTDQAMAGVVTWDKNLSKTFDKAIKAIDGVISKQLAAIMHNDDFQKLEGSWRGLKYLVMNSETGTSLKIRMLNASKRELYKDMAKATEFDQSTIFKHIYENEFGLPGGQPYGALIGDYEFTNHPEDVEFLENISGVAASAFAPFISAAAPGLFGFDSYEELNKPRDLAKIFETSEYVKWRSFRESDDSRFVNLVMPRTLARLPYGKMHTTVEEFDFEELPLDAEGNSIEAAHDDYTWMNAAYAMGARMTNAFAKYGWCTAIRGAEGGGMVEGLPTHVYKTDDGDSTIKCPTEVPIPDRREAELSGLGLLPLCHYKGTDRAVFFGAQSTQKVPKYDNPNAQANAEISARLPYLMATSRFSHYLKVMARDKIGSFQERDDIERWLNNWINQYVNSDASAGQELKAKYPLAEAKVEVKEIPGSPGAYNAVAWMRPWLQMEELTTSMRMVARLPNQA